MRRRFLVLVNPTAGVKGRGLLPRVVAALERRDAEVVIEAPARATEMRRRATEAAADRNFDAIVAAGGDGTFREVAIGALGTTIPVGLVPLGNGNVLAHDLGLGRDPERIAHVLMEGGAAEVVGGLANGEPFFLMAGAGFDARVAARLNRRLQNRLGSLAYAPPITSAIVGTPDRLRVTVDGREHDAGWVVVSNARHYAGAFELVRGTDVLEPGLHAVLFPPHGRTALIGGLLALAAGRLHRRRDIAIIPCRRVEVHADRPVPVEIDGDPFAATPLLIEPHPQTVRVIVDHFRQR